VETEANAITVSIEGIEGLSVRLHSLHEPAATERRCITGRDGLGQDVCAFNNLTAGDYLIEPEGLRVSLPISLFEHEALKTHFSLELLPSGMAGWQARIHKNTNGFQPMAKSESIITVRVAGWAGQVIILRSAQGATKFCEVIYNPVLGGLICEFGNLSPGVYQLEAATTGAATRVFVDGTGEAVVEFSPTATGEMLALLQSPPLVGHGARPQRPINPPPTSRPVSLVLAQPTATETPLPLPTPTPTATLTWQGYIVETARPGIGAIGIRAVGLKDHPVILQSGNWQSPPQLTGTKVELGDYSAEFAALGPGEYLVELVDLAELRVNLESGQFILVEFRPDPIEAP
jgi:hypothetical protein